MWKRSLVASIVLLSICSGWAHAEQGDDAMMGMQIESVAREDQSTTIVTTGAKFIITPSGEMQCWQRIPAERKVLEVKLPKAVGPLQVEKKSDFVCIVRSDSISLRVQGDSVVVFNFDKDTPASFHGLFKPAYHTVKEGRWLLIDPTGGFGVYPVAAHATNKPDFAGESWQIDYDFKAKEEAWLSVFPPRPYRWQRSFESIAHEGTIKEPYPGDALIQSVGRTCKMFFVHSYFWPGGDREPWAISTFVPSDMKEFRRMQDSVHKNGMKLIVYFSPYYYKKVGNVAGDDFVAEMKRALQDYKVDGLYFDGISMDFRQSYRIIREARRLLGDEGRLFVHCSSDPLGVGIYCPFIDTYADYILRGENGRGQLTRDDFLRWTVSGYNISNAVGYWCYYGSTGKPGYVDVVPPSEDIDASLANEVRLWREETIWTQSKGGDVSAFDKEYYGKLDLLRKRWEDHNGK
jgi:hypothetical protein